MRAINDHGEKALHEIYTPKPQLKKENVSPFGESLLDFDFKISKKKFTLGVYNELEAEILRIVRNTTDLTRLNFHVRHLFQGSLIRELRYIE